jgi:hypothetical protein
MAGNSPKALLTGSLFRQILNRTRAAVFPRKATTSGKPWDRRWSVKGFTGQRERKR